VVFKAADWRTGSTLALKRIRLNSDDEGTSRISQPAAERRKERSARYILTALLFIMRPLPIALRHS